MDQSPQDQARPDVFVAVLGPLQVTVAGETVEITAEKERTLIAALAAGGDAGVPLVRLIDELWDDPSPSSKGTLQTYVSNVRKAMRPAGSDLQAIERLGENYRFAPGEVETDIARFRSRLVAARQAHAHVDGDPLPLVEAALAEVRGPLDPSVVQATGFLAGEAARLRDEFLEAKWLWAELAIDAGQAASVVGELRAVVDEDPTEERFWRLLMLAYWRTGRQQAALDAYQQVRKVLAEELGVLPDPSLQDLEQAILRHDPTLGKPAGRPAGAGDGPPPSTQPRTGHIPAARNSFIGRYAEMNEVSALLADHALVTLRGAGGCGKTRLAREVAAAVEGRYPGGAWWVDLGEVESTGSAPVIDTIATSVGVIRRSQGSLDDALVDHLHGHTTLLVLDNCEHVIDPVADAVGWLLTECAGLTILATSRESLRVVGETVVPIRPLQVETETGPTLTDAARLFLDRARLEIDDSPEAAEIHATVEAICRRLDGVPLAIELAAALVETTPLSDILAELDTDRFDLLSVGMRGAAEHHRNLQSVVDWSYDRLEPAEQDLFVNLAIFPGSFTPAAATAVGGQGGSTTKRLLAGLVRKSLVDTVGSSGGVERYRVLETLREYGLRRLTEAGLTEQVEGRFISYYTSLAEHRTHDVSTNVVEWIGELGPDLPNLRLAISRAMETDSIDQALALIDTFHWYYNYVGSLPETEAWLRSLVPAESLPPPYRTEDPAPGRPPLTTAQQVMAYTSLASLANLRSSYRDTGHWADLAVEAAREHGDVHRRAAALVIRGTTAVFENRIDVAIEAFNESLELSTELGDRWARAVALMFMAIGERRAADQQRRAEPTSDWMSKLDATRRKFERAYELFSQSQDDRGMGMVLINLGRIEEHKGDLTAAALLCKRGLTLAESSGDSVVSSLANIFCGRIAEGMGDSEYAVECFSNALEHTESIDRSRVLFSSAAEWLGIVAARHGDVEPLLRIAAATEIYRMAPPTVGALPHLHEEKARARTTVGDARADELEADGRLMEPDAVKALAIRAGTAAVTPVLRNRAQNEDRRSNTVHNTTPRDTD